MRMCVQAGTRAHMCEIHLYICVCLTLRLLPPMNLFSVLLSMFTFDVYFPCLLFMFTFDVYCLLSCLLLMPFHALSCPLLTTPHNPLTRSLPLR